MGIRKAKSSNKKGESGATPPPVPEISQEILQNSFLLSAQSNLPSTLPGGFSGDNNYDTGAQTLEAIADTNIHAYNQATRLFLTRQLGEAWKLVIPLLKLPEVVIKQLENKEKPIKRNSISDSSSLIRIQDTQIKASCLYLTIVDEAFKLPPDDASKVFGGKKKLTETYTSVQNLSIWTSMEEYAKPNPIQDNVVIALIVLLLRRLSDEQIESKLQHMVEQFLADPSVFPFSNQNKNIRLLELYVFGILCKEKNPQYEYSLEFISNSPELSDDIKQKWTEKIKFATEERNRKENEAKLAKQKQLEENSRANKESGAIEDSQLDKTENKAENISGLSSNNEATKNTYTSKRPSKSAKFDQDTHGLSDKNGSNEKRTSSSLSPSNMSRNPHRNSNVPMRRLPPSTSANEPLNSLLTQNWHVLRILAVLGFVLSMLLKKSLRDRLRQIAQKAGNSLFNTIGMGTSVKY